jgi:hypothetical protein
MKEWVVCYTDYDAMLKDGYIEWETDSMNAWYTKKGHPTLHPITGGYGYIKEKKNAKYKKIDA